MFGATGGWAQFVWVGGAADGDIADQNNWSGGTVPTFVGGAENVTFGDATHTAVLLGSVSRSLGNLTFSSATAAYSFSGTSLPTLTLAGNITTTVANPNAVVFGSAIDPITVAFTNTAHTINVAAGSAVDFLADISGGGASILKTGTGILTLSGANTYSGGTTVHSGTLEVNGGSISHPAADLVVGDVNGDNGMLAITGGAVVNSNNGFIGNGAGSIGTVTVAGGSTVYSSWILSGGLYVGENGTGSLTLSDYYTEVDSSSVVIGDAVNSVGTVTVNDGWLNDSGALVVGESGTGILAINVNQGEVDGSSVIIGDASGGVGTVKIDGGILFDKGELLVGNSGTGTLSVANGGVVSVINGARTITLGANGGVGTLNIGAQSGDPAAAGGILNAGTVTTGSGTGTLQVNTTADSATPYYFTQNGTAGGTAVVITGPTQVINTAGFNVLTGANTYRGATTVNGGTLGVGNNASLGSGSVTLNGGQLSVGSGVTVTNPISFGSNGGTLGGNGAFGSHIVVGGNVILSPGNSPGTLTFTFGLTFGQGGAYDWQIRSVTSSLGTSWDNVAVTGPLDITATTGDPFTIRVLSLNASGSSGPVSDFSSGNNYSWIIASASGGISGFASSEFAIDISGFQNSLGGGSLFVTQDGTNLMLDFAPVPEPSTYALMAAGLMVLAWRRRRILRG